MHYGINNSVTHQFNDHLVKPIFPFHMNNFRKDSNTNPEIETNKTSYSTETNVMAPFKRKK